MKCKLKSKNIKNNGWHSGFLVIGMGFEAIILLFIGIYIGQKADSYFNTGAGITAIIVVFILVIWFYQLIRIFK